MPNQHTGPDDPVKRFWRHVDVTPGCWSWKGYVGDGGYGKFRAKTGSTVYAHRFSYEIHVGPIPTGLQIDHLCRNRKCVNWMHLEAVTPRDNVRRGVGITAVHAAKTKCAKGHEFTPENTIRTKLGRACRACRAGYEYERRVVNRDKYNVYQAAQHRAWYAKKKEKLNAERTDRDRKDNHQRA